MWASCNHMSPSKQKRKAKEAIRDYVAEEENRGEKRQKVRSERFKS